MRVGDYELEEELGRGAMGVVHKARHVTLNRHVALKQLLKLNPERARRFATEASALGRLHHPHIVQVHEVGTDADGRPFIAMAYVEGRPLEERLREGPLPPRRAAEVALALARALEHAHTAGVLHRDIKPANVLLSAAGEHPVLTDFGLAQELSDERERLTRSGQLLGTPVYMAPEQAAGELSAIGPETDVYGLGATLYAMLTGGPPFEAATLLAQVAQVCEAKPRPPGVDRTLDAITLTCLAKAPRDRYPDAGELARALEGYLRGTPVRASGVRGHRVLTPRRLALLGLVLGGMTALGFGLAQLVQATAPDAPALEPLPARRPTAAPAPDPVDRELAALEAEADPARWRAAAARWLKGHAEHARAKAIGERLVRLGLGAPRWTEIRGERRPYHVFFLDRWRALTLRDLDGRFDVWHLREDAHQGSYGAPDRNTVFWGSTWAPQARVVLKRTGGATYERWGLATARPRKLSTVTVPVPLTSEWAVSAHERHLAILRLPQGIGPTDPCWVELFDLRRPEDVPRRLETRIGALRDLDWVGERLILSGQKEVVTYDPGQPAPRPVVIPRATAFVVGHAERGLGLVHDERGRLALVRLATGHRISELPDSPRVTEARHGVTATFTPDGKRLYLRVAGAPSTWEVWDLDPPRRALRAACGLPAKHPQNVNALALAPGGARLVGVSWCEPYNLLVRWVIGPERGE